MKLFYAPQSPFARKVRVVSIEIGVEEQIELVFIKVLPGTPNTTFQNTHNPLRKIPALETSGGSTIYDSTVICEYLDSLSGVTKMIPADGPERWRTLTNHALAQGMCESAVLIRYETWLRPEPLRWANWTNDQWDRINTGLEWFERNDEAVGGQIDLAQITLGCLLGYMDFRWPDNGWRERYPNISDWYEILMRRPSFSRTIPQDPSPA